MVASLNAVTSQLVTRLEEGAGAREVCSLHDQAVGAGAAAAAWGAVLCLGLHGRPVAVALAQADVCAAQVGAELLRQGSALVSLACPVHPEAQDRTEGAVHCPGLRGWLTASAVLDRAQGRAQAGYLLPSGTAARNTHH